MLGFIQLLDFMKKCTGDPGLSHSLEITDDGGLDTIILRLRRPSDDVIAQRVIILGEISRNYLELEDIIAYELKWMKKRIMSHNKGNNNVGI